MLAAAAAAKTSGSAAKWSFGFSTSSDTSSDEMFKV
jgi:hypothetical protein